MRYSRQPHIVLKILAKTLLVFGVPEPWRISMVRRARTGQLAVALEKLCRHPGYLRIRAWKSFLRHRHRGVPFRQSLAFDALVRIDEFHHSIGAETILNAGTLLGAVRQGAFAGRPGDLDLFVMHKLGIDDYLRRVEVNGRAFGIRGARHKLTMQGPAKLKLRAPIRVDVLVLAANPERSGFHAPERVYDRQDRLVDWPGRGQALTAQVFGRRFFIPGNYVGILERNYGAGWRTSMVKQHATRHPRIE